MNASEDETAGKDRPETAQAFMALPARTGDSRELFMECLADLVRVVGLDVPAEPDPDDRRGWRLQVRAALRNAGSDGLPASDAAFGALMKAAVRGYITVTDRVKEMTAETREQFQDLAAEVRDERRRQAEADAADAEEEPEAESGTERASGSTSSAESMIARSSRNHCTSDPATATDPSSA